MLRRMFTLLSAASLVVSVATCVLWVRSYWRSDTVYRQASPETWSVASNHGGLTVGRREYSGLALDDAPWRFYSGDAHDRGYGVRRWSIAGFGRGDIQGTEGSGALAYAFSDDYWTVPCWFLLGLAAIVPGVWSVGLYRRRVRRLRRIGGRCPACGYDLRATPGRCPECGAVPAVAK